MLAFTNREPSPWRDRTGFILSTHPIYTVSTLIRLSCVSPVVSSDRPRLLRARTTMASPAAAAARGAVPRMVCSTLETLRARLGSQSRIAALDVTPTHVSLAVSDASRTSAAPLGVMRRTASPAADARILAGALSRGDPELRVGALVVGSPPGSPPADYVGELLTEAKLLPDAESVLYYSEAAAVLRAARNAADAAAAAEKALPGRETRKRGRFETAMFPDIEAESVRADRGARARVSATEILQAALDDLARLPADADGR